MNNEDLERANKLKESIDHYEACINDNAMAVIYFNGRYKMDLLGFPKTRKVLMEELNSQLLELKKEFESI
jgi:hypothetical protein